MIYIAAKEDLAFIVKNALKIPDELGFENFPKKDVAKVTEWIYNNWLETPIFVYKDKPQGEILGFVGVQLTELWWSKDQVLNDYVFYIMPEHRNMKVIGALIEAVRDFAKVNKLPYVTNFIAAKGIETKRKLFERKGFKEAGFIATYGV